MRWTALAHAALTFATLACTPPPTPKGISSADERDLERIKNKSETPSEPSSPFPTKVSGFRLGASPEEFVDECRKAGASVVFLGKNGPVSPRSWKDVRMLFCSEEREPSGFDAGGVFAKMCPSQTVCEITIDVHDDGERAASARVANKSSSRLQKKYGPPSFDEGKSFKEVEVDCITSQFPANRREIWLWNSSGKPAGRMVLGFSCTKAAPLAAALIIYQNTEATLERYLDAAQEEENY